MFLRTSFRKSFQTRFRGAAFCPICAVLAVVVSVSPAFAQKDKNQNNKSQGNASQHQAEKSSTPAVVARGKYLVEDVAMCGTCHTPTDGSGNPDHSRWLQGTSVPYMPSRPSPDWPISAPRIGGTPPADDADMIKLLMTGIWTTGNHLRLPMPQFRMERSDAEAVVAYLKTVKAQQ